MIKTFDEFNKKEENTLEEKRSFLFGVDENDIKLSGLKQCLDAFNNGNRGDYKRGNWKIVNGGYDLDWELYFNNVPFMERVSGENPSFENTEMPYEIALKIAGVVEAVFDMKVDMSSYEDE